MKIFKKKLNQRKIAMMLKKNEFLYSEMAKEHNISIIFCFPSYDLHFILEPKTAENPFSF